MSNNLKYFLILFIVVSVLYLSIPVTKSIPTQVPYQEAYQVSIQEPYQEPQEQQIKEPYTVDVEQQRVTNDYSPVYGLDGHLNPDGTYTSYYQTTIGNYKAPLGWKIIYERDAGGGTTSPSVHGGCAGCRMTEITFEPIEVVQITKYNTSYITLYQTKYRTSYRTEYKTSYRTEYIDITKTQFEWLIG